MSEKHDEILDLDINSNVPKLGGFFATDQTPTPTKFCEEYGIFEDLKLVNPFDEIFRHAVEEKEKNGGKITTKEHQSSQLTVQDEESLHTPQVFPQLEITSTHAPTPARQQSTPLITDLVMTEAETGNNTIKKYRAIAEKPSTVSSNVATKNIMQLTQSPAALITLNIGEPNCKGSSITTTTIGTAIPIQTVKPLILPKVQIETKLKPNNQASNTSGNTNNNGMCTVTSPSSASLTPTSQLPIKERLKVILNNNSKTQRALIANVIDIPKANYLKNNNKKSRLHEASGKYDEHCMERRRAAATRYRNKMRNEHKELRKRNAELLIENEKLRARITQLEQQQRSTAVMTHSPSNAQIHIPPSSIHLIMNIPKLLVPADGPPLLHNPITYSVEKK